MGWSHLYATAHGEWTGTNWTGEHAQIGFRWSAWKESGNQVPAPDYPKHSGGSTGGSDATFNYVVNWSAVVPGAGPGDEYNLNAAWQLAMAHDVATFLNAVKSHQASIFRWTHLKLSLLARTSEVSGKDRYTLYPGSVFTFKAPILGTGTGTFPPEVSIAMSTRTNVVGKRGRGRMYLPAITIAVSDGSGTVPAATRAAIAGSLATLADNLANEPGLDPLGMNSGMVTTSPGSAWMLVPEETRVGNHYDSQRRRQHQVPEVYSTVGL